MRAHPDALSRPCGYHAGVARLPAYDATGVAMRLTSAQAAAKMEARVADLDMPARECRVCGCTDDRACVVAGAACHWIEDDLCSACEERERTLRLVRAL